MIINTLHKGDDDDDDDDNNSIYFIIKFQCKWMHKSIQQIFRLIFIRFFLCKLPWKKLETKTTDCGRWKIGLIKNKNTLQYTT